VSKKLYTKNGQKPWSRLWWKHVCKSAFYHIQNITKIRYWDICTHIYIKQTWFLLYSLQQCVIDKLQHCQSSAARLVTRTWKYEHITPVLMVLQWLRVEKRITYKILLLTYKSLNGMAPKYLSNLLHHYNPTRQLRSASKHLLISPKVNLKSYGKITFKSASPRLWNSLPEDVWLGSSLDSFKIKDIPI
jgi:hypothetical protein